MEANPDKRLDPALPETIIPWPSRLYEKLHCVGFLFLSCLFLVLFGLSWVSKICQSYGERLRGYVQVYQK